MKIKTIFLLPILVFGLIVLSCDDEIEGIWVSENGRAENAYHKGNIEWYYDGEPVFKGKYSISGDKITQTPTHIYGKNVKELLLMIKIVSDVDESKWYSKEEVENKFTQDIEKKILIPAFDSKTFTCSVSGETLTMINERSAAGGNFSRKTI